MSDIFREVEEDVRRERYQHLWDQYGTLIIAVVVVLIGSVGGYQLWQGYQSNQRLADADRFLAASDQALGEDQEAAIAAFGALSEDARSSGYEVLAKLRQAGLLGETGKQEEAIALFDEIAADPSVDDAFRRLAELKAAVLVAETAPYQDIRDRVVPLSESQTPWRFTALEILGYAAFKNDDRARAVQSFQRLAQDPQTPVTIRTRATEMLIVLNVPEVEAAPLDPLAVDPNETDADNTATQVE